MKFGCFRTRVVGGALLGMIILLGAAIPGVDPVVATRAVLQKAKAQAAATPRAALVPRESYVQPPEIVDVRLSPNGAYVSILRRGERGVDVILQDVSTGVQTRIAAGLQRAEAAWSGDGRRLWLADDQGLAVIESAERTSKRIVKWDQRAKQRFWGVDARAPQYALLNERFVQSGAERHRYLRVDAQGKTRVLLETALPLRSILLNAGGDIAFSAAFEGPRYETVIRQHTAAGPRELLRCGSLEECRLVGYDETQKTVWLMANHDEDKFTLRRWRQEDGRWETVHRDPADVAGADALVWNVAKESWSAIAYHDGRRRWYGNDSGTRAALTALERQLPDANLQLSATTDGRVWLVQAQQGDLANDRYYTYRPAENRLYPLFAREDGTKNTPPPGAPMHPISYRARDGMLLHGYILLPNGVAPAAAPLIAWLHGGPITRAYDRYDPSMQLLVNRGYAVFVPNFRASTGYGSNYVRSANGDVGNGRVLSDIIDGLDFLLAEGVGDRKRQAVMGISFGGYASLLAVSHHPWRFRFAFAGAPPTDYGWIKQWQAEHDSESLRPEGPPLSLQFRQLGFRYNNADWRTKMQRESPLATLPALQTPVYIWAGANDDRVPLKSIVHYVGEARRLGKPVSFLIDPDAGHGPAGALGAEAYLYQVEAAAQRHFGGEVSPVSPELRRFLGRNLRIDSGARRTN